MHVDAIEHDPGIYFGIPEQQYHNDPALGSSDLKKLKESPPTFWFESKYNPLWEPSESTPAQRLGTARHKLVLEGRDAFVARYAPRMHSGNTKEGRRENEEIADAGKIGIPFEEFQSIMLSSAMIRSNPSISQAFEGGAGSEVSVFWRGEDGFRRKCRFDYFKKNAIVDLKNVANMFNKDFPTACREAIANYRYDMQAAHYLNGRAVARQFWKEKKVFGDFDRKALEACMHDGPIAWVWIFYQSSGAPLTWGAVISPENPILQLARTHIGMAEENLRQYVERFGVDTPWIHDEPLRELDVNELPGWWAR